jgi:hypothetical protein
MAGDQSNRFNIVEQIESRAMHLSNCLDDIEKIVPDIESGKWTKDTDPVAVGSLGFIESDEPWYKEIHDAMEHATEIFLSNTGRDISDYTHQFNFHRIVRWETKNKPITEHKDVWDPKGDEKIPALTLVMYLTSDYEGGIFRFPLLNKAIKPLAGDIIIFNSDTVHAIDEYLGGRRMTIRRFLFKK